MAVIFTRNDALNINPQAGDTHLSVGGSDWLWAVTAVYLLSFVSPSYTTHYNSITNTYSSSSSP